MCGSIFHLTPIDRKIVDKTKAVCSLIKMQLPYSDVTTTTNLKSLVTEVKQQKNCE